MPNLKSILTKYMPPFNFMASFLLLPALPCFATNLILLFMPRGSWWYLEVSRQNEQFTSVDKDHSVFDSKQARQCLPWGAFTVYDICYSSFSINDLWLKRNCVSATSAKAISLCAWSTLFKSLLSPIPF